MKLFGIIGYPLGHSFSRNYFNEKFATEGLDAAYVNFEIPSIEEFPNVIATNPELQGMNVTLPYKQQVIPYLDDLDESAREIGAVNVIKFIRKDGERLKLKGYNSDVIGFTESIRPLLKAHHAKALVLGTGGASKAIVYGLRKSGVEPVYVSRTKKEGMLTYEELTPKVMNEHKVIVNCTPVGMYPKVDECPDIPYELLTPSHLLYDLTYNPAETLFMKKGANFGAVVKNGMEMLLLQAVGAWNIWNKE